ncbi:SCO family protein [uncultured Neptuniibacter sp.]|uniref:SCO family protein n=1 Tax=uncultured Neptuniibacter sp. TaxID=502143 RepID=UPI00262164BD|nr:SCO family protein [uncultured Neptuniibacter sp.]
MKALRNLLLLTVFMLVGVAIAFYFRPQPVEQRIALGEQLGGDFTLQAENGPLRLEDYRGKVVLFFIGYASCPDICPTALAVASQGLKRLSQTEQQEVAGIFMSVDPKRDSPEKLAKYAGFFHPNFTGGTADRETIDKVVKQYGAFYRMVDLDGSAMGYAVDHSSRLYVINKEGKLAKALAHATNPDALAAEIRNLL